MTILKIHGGIEGMVTIRFYDDVSVVIREVAIPKLAKKFGIEYCTYDDVRDRNSKVTKVWNSKAQRYDTNIGWKGIEEDKQYIVFVQAYWRTDGAEEYKEIINNVRKDNITGVVVFSTFSDDAIEDTSALFTKNGINVNDKVKLVGSPNEKMMLLKSVIDGILKSK